MKWIRKTARCLCARGINLVLIMPKARGIIHENLHSLLPLSPPAMRNITRGQEQAFALKRRGPWQNRVVIMWNYWYKQTDKRPLGTQRLLCVSGRWMRINVQRLHVLLWHCECFVRFLVGWEIFWLLWYRVILGNAEEGWWEGLDFYYSPNF